ncbi:MAG: DUF4926 domain-containing protein [Nitrospira sp.]
MTHTYSHMPFDLFSKVTLAVDVPSHRLRKGDVATIVETHAGPAGGEPGYSLEVFNAVGETLAVVTLRESQIDP